MSIIQNPTVDNFNANNIPCFTSNFELDIFLSSADFDDDEMNVNVPPGNQQHHIMMDQNPTVDNFNVNNIPCFTSDFELDIFLSSADFDDDEMNVNVPPGNQQHRSMMDRNNEAPPKFRVQSCNCKHQKPKHDKRGPLCHRSFRKGYLKGHK